MTLGAAPRILVTGLGGFAGRHLAAEFARLWPEAELLPLGADLADQKAVRERVAAARPDACLHLAGISAIAAAQEQPGQAWQVNLHGTLALAEALSLARPDAVLVHVSSGDAYGRSFAADAREAGLDETAPLAPVNVYGATKAAADLALGALPEPGVRGGLHVVRLRPFNHVGAGQSDAFVLPAFARQLARIARGRQPPLLQVGNLGSERDFLDVRDVVGAYARALRLGTGLPNRAVLNIASGVPRRIGAVLDELVTLSGLSVEIRADPGRVRAADIPRAVGNATRAQDLLGWRPMVPWRETLSAVLEDWLRREAA